MKNILIGLFGIVTGFLVGAYVYKYSSKPIKAEIPKENFQAFADNEMQAYALAQTAEEKLKAADEMYGKMVVIFLSDLGLKIEKPISEPEVSSTGIPEVNAPKPDGEEVTSPIKDSIVIEEPSKSELAPETPETPKQAQDLGRPGSLEHYKKSRYIKELTEKNNRMTGHFEGSLTHKTKQHRGRVDRIVMDINLVEENKVLLGEALIVLSDPSGNEYSRLNVSRGDKVFKEISDNPNTYYIDASPSSYILLNLNEYPKLLGEFYKQGEFIGTVTLKKY